MTHSVPNLAAVKSLSEEEMFEGYWDGYSGEPEPGDNRSDAYWHGWRNGASDHGFRSIDAEQRVIAVEFVARSRKEIA